VTTTCLEALYFDDEIREKKGSYWNRDEIYVQSFARINSSRSHLFQERGRKVTKKGYFVPVFMLSLRGLARIIGFSPIEYDSAN
jgi:hypothetical protein